jgi:excisionase family DNA binding protein
MDIEKSSVGRAGATYGTTAYQFLPVGRRAGTGDDCDHVCIESPSVEQALEALITRKVDEAFARLDITAGWLNVKQAATYTGLSERAIRESIESHNLPCHRTPSNRILLRVSEIDAWICGEC